MDANREYKILHFGIVFSQRFLVFLDIYDLVTPVSLIIVFGHMFTVVSLKYFVAHMSSVLFWCHAHRYCSHLFFNFARISFHKHMYEFGNL